MGAVKDLVDSAIKENDVLVFSKSYCPVSREFWEWWDYFGYMENLGIGDVDHGRMDDEMDVHSAIDVLVMTNQLRARLQRSPIPVPTSPKL